VTTIATLVVKLTTDADEYRGGLQKSAKQAESWRTSVTRSADGVRRSLTRSARGLKAIPADLKVVLGGMKEVAGGLADAALGAGRGIVSLGRAVVERIPFLERFSQGVGRLAGKIGELPAKIKSWTAGLLSNARQHIANLPLVQRFGDMIGRAREALGTLANNIKGRVAPVLEKVTGVFRTLGETVGKPVFEGFKRALGGVMRVAEGGLNILGKLGGVVGGLGRAALRALGGVGKLAAGLGQRLLPHLKRLGTLALAGGAALVGGLALGIAKIGPAAVDAASDFDESLAKVQTVFGDSAAAVEDFSKTTAWSLGISQREALATAGTYGNLFTAMGVGQEAAAGMSTELVTLAADLASFNNMDPTEVLDKLRAGLVGEAEPLRALGVNLTAVAVEAKAMELGLADANGELSEAAKLQARYALILEQSTTAQGDFARTADGLANTQRVLKAVWQDTLQEIGRTVLPIVLALLQEFKPILMDQILPALTVVLDAVTLFTSQLASGTDPLTAFKILLLQLVPEPVYNAIMQVVSGVQQFIEQVRPVVVEVASWLAKNVELQDVLLGLAGAIAVVVVPALVAVAQIVLPIIAVFALVVAAAVALRAAWESNFLGIRDKAQAVWGWLKEFIPQAIQAIRDVVVAVTSAIREFWAEHGDAIMAKAQSVWEGIVGVFEWFKGQFMGVYDAFRSAFEGDWYAFGEKMRKVWNDAWLKIKEIGAEAIEAVQKFFTETDWGELGRGILDGIAKGITSGLDIIKTAAQDAASAALEAARGFLGIKSPAKKTIPVGVDFNQGIVVGLEETSAIERAAQDAGATALRGAETGMGGGTQNALHLYNPIFQGVQDAEGLFSEVAGMVVT
jgi:hypothetical protein